MHTPSETRLGYNADVFLVMFTRYCRRQHDGS